MKIKRKISLIIFILCVLINIGRAEDRGEIIGTRLLSLNRVHNFLVLDIGTEEGISEGMRLNLLKDGKDIAILEVIRAKENVAACDIKHVEPNMFLKEGDVYSVVISKGIFRRPTRLIPEKKEEKKEKSVMEKVTPFLKRKKKEPPLLITALPMIVRIESRKEIVNYYINETLREMNFIITSFNTKEGIFRAHKFLPLSLRDELWADLIGTTDHRAIYEINTIEDETGTTLKLDIRITYTRRDGKTAEKSVWQASPVVKEALELVKRVKNMSERF